MHMHARAFARIAAGLPVMAGRAAAI